MTYSLKTLEHSADEQAPVTGWRRLYQELSLTLGFLGLAFWLLALLTHSASDPAWTTSGLAYRWLGFNGSALLFIVFMVVGLSWVFRFSWLQVAERLGTWVELGYFRWKEKREMAKDVALGQAAALERENQLDTHHGSAQPQEPTYESPLHRQMEVDQPLEPEPMKIVIEPEPKVFSSNRVTRERQKPLFADMPDSRLPQIDLLDESTTRMDTVDPEALEITSRLIERRLKEFGVEVRVVAAYPGPVVTRFEVEPAVGVKGAQVVNLAKDLARSLSLVSIRVVETIPGKNYMALELPNAKRQSIRLSEILGSNTYNEAKSILTMGLGKDIVGNPVVADLAKMPHVLVAGTTGSGKSVGINAMILSLLYKAEARDVRLLMIDPKMLEMSVYEGIPHLLAPVVTDMKQAAHGLNWCVAEMERRYKLMSKLGVRNLSGYNHKIEEAKESGHPIGNPFSLTPEAPEPLERLPHIVVVIDELADLMMVVGKKIEELIARLAQKARAAGIHLILATQRPSVDVITGLIKANIPTRIAFQVSSKIDSRTILDQMGAEALLGMGDMLYLPSGTGLPIRVHGAFVSDDEVHRVVKYLKTQGEPDYIQGVLDGSGQEGESSSGPDLFGEQVGEKDPLYDQAVEIVLKNRKASISLVQRHLKIGYNRAARLVEDMEKAGLVSAMSTNGQRDILVPSRGEEA
ncbi:MAG: DNA translocase FtsK [Betaproteobacteria bacterium]|nr:DNA translocase FtsK [Betaproteobacteria bacterium]